MSYKAKILELAAGGSNASLTASNGGIIYSNATSMAVLASTSTANQPLLSGASGAPGWSTATYPGSTTINQLIYSTANNVIGQLATANNGLLVTSAAGAPSILAGPGTTGNFLTSNAGAAPSWSTATFPAGSGSVGTILRSDGTNWVATTATYPATTTINQLIYSTANNVIGQLSTANNGTLVTSSAGVPSILAGPGTTGNVLQSNAAAAPSFSTATYPSVATGTGTILRADGTNWVATTATYPATTSVSQILYSSATNVVGGITTANNGTLITGATGIPSVLANGTTGQVLTATTGSPPSWVAPATAGDVVGPGSSTDNALVRFDSTTGKLIQNGVITEDDTGNLSVAAAVSGASLSALVSNTSNTASATAFMEAKVAGSTADDAYYKADIASGQNWSWGLDNSASDAFVISSNATLGTNNIMSVATTGEINYPLQPAFMAFLATTDTNVTGDSTNFTIGSGNALTEIFDQNGDFNTNGTFTAPVTGRYKLNSRVYVIGGTVITNLNYTLVTSNRTYRVDGSAVQGATTGTNPGIDVLADMDAADIANIKVLTIDSGGKVDDVFGNATNPFTWFSGNLVC